MELFDASCHDTLPMEVDPEYDLDASDTGAFILKFGEIMMRVNGQGDIPVAWIMFPTARGSDALFMADWALAGHYLTGDNRFLDFLDKLIAENDFWAVVNTMGSFYLPKWCKSFYGLSLLYPTFWNIQNRVDRKIYPEFWNKLGRAIKEEFRYKELNEENDAYFGVLYDTMVDGVIDPDAKKYVMKMIGMLKETGQYQVNDPFEPRRSYNVDLLNNPPEDFSIETEPLTQEEKDICLKSVDLFGMKIEGFIYDEFPRANEGMPIKFRIGGPFQWQEDPFMIYKDYGDRNGRTQWPMSCFSVAYWTGRMQGTIASGKGTALAWKETEEQCE
jgi:hypothetical protein